MGSWPAKICPHIFCAGIAPPAGLFAADFLWTPSTFCSDTQGTVIVESISRFARNTRDLLELVEQLAAKGVEFVSQKEAIDTATPTGKFMLTVFGAVAELEREYILQRQREGIEIAKAQGKYRGRKPIQRDQFDSIVLQWRNGQIPAVQAIRQLQISKSTFYRKVKVGPYASQKGISDT